MKAMSQSACLRHTLAAGVFSIGITLVAAPASAQIVFDPSNYTQNVLTAARALQQINNQITSLANQTQMLMNQARQLASLPTSVLSQIKGNFTEMKRLMGEADRLAYNVSNIESQFSSTFQNFAVGKSDAQLITSARERWQQSLSAYEHSLKAGAVAVQNLDSTRSQTGTLVASSQSAVGILQATQAGNQLLGVQTSQLADLTAMLAAQGRANALEKSRQAAAQEQAREQLGRFLTGSSYSPATVRMFHN